MAEAEQYKTPNLDAPETSLNAPEKGKTEKTDHIKDWAKEKTKMSAKIDEIISKLLLTTDKQKKAAQVTKEALKTITNNKLDPIVTKYKKTEANLKKLGLTENEELKKVKDEVDAFIENFNNPETQAGLQGIAKKMIEAISGNVEQQTTLMAEALQDYLKLGETPAAQEKAKVLARVLLETETRYVSLSKANDYLQRKPEDLMKELLTPEVITTAVSKAAEKLPKIEATKDETTYFTTLLETLTKDDGKSYKESLGDKAGAVIEALANQYAIKEDSKGNTIMLIDVVNKKADTPTALIPEIEEFINGKTYEKKDYKDKVDARKTALEDMVAEVKNTGLGNLFDFSGKVDTEAELKDDKNFSALVDELGELQDYEDKLKQISNPDSAKAISDLDGTTLEEDASDQATKAKEKIDNYRNEILSGNISAIAKVILMIVQAFKNKDFGTAIEAIEASQKGLDPVAIRTKCEGVYKEYMKKESVKTAQIFDIYLDEEGTGASASEVFRPNEKAPDEEKGLLTQFRDSAPETAAKELIKERLGVASVESISKDDKGEITLKYVKTGETTVSEIKFNPTAEDSNTFDEIKAKISTAKPATEAQPAGTEKTADRASKVDGMDNKQLKAAIDKVKADPALGKAYKEFINGKPQKTAEEIKKVRTDFLKSDKVSDDAFKKLIPEAAPTAAPAAEKAPDTIKKIEGILDAKFVNDKNEITKEGGAKQIQDILDPIKVSAGKIKLKGTNTIIDVTYDAAKKTFVTTDTGNKRNAENGRFKILAGDQIVSTEAVTATTSAKKIDIKEGETKEITMTDKLKNELGKEKIDSILKEINDNPTLKGKAITLNGAMLSPNLFTLDLTVDGKKVEELEGSGGTMDYARTQVIDKIRSYKKQ